MGGYGLRATGCGLLLLAALPARGQEPAPAAEPGTRLYVLADSVSVGERFEVAVALTHEGTAVAFPEVPAGDPEAGPLLSFGDAEVLDVRRLPPRVEGRVRADSVVYLAATFALDAATVGPVTMQVVAGGDTTVVATGTHVLPVRDEVPSMQEPLKPPAPPEPFPSPWPLYTLLTLVALALGLLAAWAFRRARRRRRGSTAPMLAPYPEALARLDALAEPSSPEAAKGYYVALSDLLRRYLARTLGIPALEQTTGELVQALRQDRRLPDDAVSAVRGTLRLCDLVKFADLRPDAEVHGAARARAREAVEAVEAAAHPPVLEDGASRIEDGTGVASA